MSISLPYLLLLFPASVTILLLLQFFRSRRQDVLVGSLLIWRRVAEQIQTPTPKRIRLDRTFLIQTAVTACLAMALASAFITYSGHPGRRLVLVLDNGPASRMLDSKGHPLWQGSHDAAKKKFQPELKPDDHVALIMSGPRPTRLDDGQGFTPAIAQEKLAILRPAISFVPIEDVTRFANEVARNFTSASSKETTPLICFSARGWPATLPKQANVHWYQRNRTTQLTNVSLSVFGSTQLPDQLGAEILVQVHNHSLMLQEGTLFLDIQSTTPPTPEKKHAKTQERRLMIQAHAISIATFSLPDPTAPIRLRWVGTNADAFPEDDTLIALPHAQGKPKIRIHGSAPDLETLLRKGCRAQILKPTSKKPCDLEIFINEMPGHSLALQSTSAVAFFAPTQAFEMFEVQSKTIKAPRAFLANPDPLTRNVKPMADGISFPIAESRVLTAIGDWHVILKDEADHPLIARFRLKDGRPAFVFSFIPGDGLGWDDKRAFRNDTMLAILIRMIHEAAGAGEPYHITRFAQLEGQSGTSTPTPVQSNWDSKNTTSYGVLDLDASTPARAASTETPVTLPKLSSTPNEQGTPLWPWFIIGAMILTIIEVNLKSKGN